MFVEFEKSAGYNETVFRPEKSEKRKAEISENPANIAGNYYIY